jgi:hypothetical protein
LFISHSNFFSFFVFGSILLRFDIRSIDSDLGIDLKTNKLLPFIVAIDVSDNKDGTQLVEMLGDLLGVWFVSKLGIAKVEKKRVSFPQQ